MWTSERQGCDMAAAVFRLTFILAVMIPYVMPYLIVECRGQYNKTFTMFDLFSTPYANLGNITGHLYYQNTTCVSPVPSPPLVLPDNTTNSILLLSNYNECILERILLARSQGYDAILTYTVDNVNTTITEAIANTGVPLAIIDYSAVDTLLTNVIVTVNNTNTTVSIDGSIVAGIVIVSFAFISLLSCTCCFAICGCLCFKFCREFNGDQGDLQPLLAEDRTRYGNRQELIESILRHLQEMERDIGTQTPLSPETINKFPTRKYANDEQHTTCAVCVDEFKVGVPVRQLPCQHIFHPECIDEWLNEYSSVCPLCKMNLKDTQTLPGLGIEEQGHLSHTGSTGSSSFDTPDHGVV